MSSDQEDAAARRSRIVDAVDHTENHPSGGHHLRSFLEAPLRDSANGDPFTVVAHGSSAPIVLVKKAFYSPDDGKRHYGLFDPDGHPSDLPFRTSEWSE